LREKTRRMHPVKQDASCGILRNPV
jgi:hypothetical protein